MQVLKRISIFFLILGLFGCSNRLTDNRIEISNQKYDIIDYDTISSQIEQNKVLNVAALLPLSGKASSIGKGMQNAMFMALDLPSSKNIVLKFYDTQSSSLGAQTAIYKAIEEGAELILGPLMFDEVEGIAKIALSENVPVISFTTSPQVLQKGIYSIGFLNAEQIKRVLTYAQSQKKTRLALLVPDNNSGLNVVKSTLMSVQNKEIDLVKVGFYNQASLDFTSLVNSMSEEKDFDAVLIADGGNRLKSLVSMFAYNDIMYPEVLFMGTSAWDNTNLSKETILYHGVYPMVSKTNSLRFVEEYKNMFGEAPKNIYSLAYDSVLLSFGLAVSQNDNIEETLTSQDGFTGINGDFKILPTGQSRYSLDIYEITANGPMVVSKGQKEETHLENEVDIRYIPYDELPEIYGKNKAEVLKWLYNN